MQLNVMVKYTMSKCMEQSGQDELERSKENLDG